MASLELEPKWVRYAPDIGNNRSLPEEERLWLEVSGRLTRQQLVDLASAIREPPQAEGESVRDARIRALSKHVRLVGGPHRLGGREVKDLKDYLLACDDMPDGYNLREAFGVVGHVNSLTEEEVVFSERRSGGRASTPRRNAASDDEKTAGR